MNSLHFLTNVYFQIQSDTDFEVDLHPPGTNFKSEFTPPLLIAIVILWYSISLRAKWWWNHGCFRWYHSFDAREYSGGMIQLHIFSYLRYSEDWTDTEECMILNWILCRVEAVALPEWLFSPQEDVRASVDSKLRLISQERLAMR